MSERKVLNKYFPPDFDPSKIPRGRKGEKNVKFCIRLMAPCNMRCNTCGEYIYKGKKFNSRKEDVMDKTYLGLRIFRFYIRCPRCLQEISFRTDPESTDYVLEAGASRNFQALKLAEEQAERELKEKEDEIKNNPMKLLEQRTEQSRREMEEIEALEELRERNRTQATLDFDSLIQQKIDEGQQTRKTQAEIEAEEDEEEIRRIFGKTSDGSSVKRLLVPDSDSSDDEQRSKKSKPETSSASHATPCTTILLSKEVEKPKPWEKSIGTMKFDKKKLVLIKKK